MIPRDYITEWRQQAPWAQDFQVEQDLIIFRALVAIFGHPVLSNAFAFRGGTALYKLYLTTCALF
jgi:predicted nucleotidyltransferase component of viral defense system